MNLSTILNKKNIPYFVIAALVIYILMIGKSEVIEVKIPSKENSVKISGPEPEVRVDTIYKNVFVDGKKVVQKQVVEVENPVNKELLQKYEEAVRANDSLQQVKVFKDAIKERKYTERLEDSVQVITVKSEVIGTLKSQLIEYKTKEQVIEVKTKRMRPTVYVGGFSSLPTIPDASPTFGVQLQIANKKRVLTFGIDNQKTVQVGIALKLF